MYLLRSERNGVLSRPCRGAPLKADAGVNMRINGRYELVGGEKQTSRRMKFQLGKSADL